MDVKLDRLMTFMRGFKRGATGGNAESSADEAWLRGYEEGRRAFMKALDEETARLSAASTNRIKAVQAAGR